MMSKANKILKKEICKIRRMPHVRLKNWNFDNLITYMQGLQLRRNNHVIIITIKFQIVYWQLTTSKFWEQLRQYKHTCLFILYIYINIELATLLHKNNSLQFFLIKYSIYRHLLLICKNIKLRLHGAWNTKMLKRGRQN